MSRSVNFWKQPTVTAGAYASTKVVGGLLTLPFGSGIIDHLSVLSLSGQTPTLYAFLFNANPSNSTFTDNGALVLANADARKLLVSPIAVTLAAPVGCVQSIGSAEQLGISFQNLGATPGENSSLYAALVSGSTFTPGSVSDIIFTLGGYQD